MKTFVEKHPKASSTGKGGTKVDRQVPALDQSQTKLWRMTKDQLSKVGQWCTQAIYHVGRTRTSRPVTSTALSNEDADVGLSAMNESVSGSEEATVDSDLSSSGANSSGTARRGGVDTRLVSRVGSTSSGQPADKRRKTALRTARRTRGGGGGRAAGPRSGTPAGGPPPAAGASRTSLRDIRVDVDVAAFADGSYGGAVVAAVICGSLEHQRAVLARDAAAALEHAPKDEARVCREAELKHVL